MLDVSPANSYGRFDWSLCLHSHKDRGETPKHLKKRTAYSNGQPSYAKM
jgi:hypothetical protein